MSVHHSQAHVYQNCDIQNILSDAMHRDISLDTLGAIVKADAIRSTLQEHYVSVTYDSKIVNVCGSNVKYCANAYVEFYTLDGKFYYPIDSVRDCGDEGSYTTDHFLCSDTDLIRTHASYFDELKY